MEKSSSTGGKSVAFGLLMALFLLFQAPTQTAQAAAVFVQSASFTSNSGSTTVAASFPSANTAGNFIAVVVSFDSAGGTTWSCADSQANVYSQATFSNDTRHNQTLGICYAPNIKAGANTVTVSFGGVSQTWRRLAIHEYSGVDAVSPLDKTGAAIGTGSALASPSVTPSQNGELIFGAAVNTGSAATISAGSGFTLRQAVGNGAAAPAASADQTQGTAAPVTANFNLSASADYIVHVATFRANGTPPPPDTTAPTVSMTAPAFNATVSGTATTVSANASDNIGVTGVQFLLDGANLGAEDTTSPYSITWNTTTASNGAHTLSARARDAAGNTSNAITNVNITVDNQAPIGNIAINNGAQATNTRSVTLNLSATDALGTVTQMRISNTTSFPAAETYATTKAWTLSSGTGTKTVNAQFKDAAGNWSGTFSDTIIYETTAPTVSAVSATNITNGSATINWTTNEPATSQVEYGLTTSYGQSTPLDTNLLTAHSVPLSNLASQTTYNYRVLSRDAAGNLRTGNNNTFTTLSGPDTTPPTIPTGLAATPVSTTQINLSWNASTDNVGVTAYNLYRDGNLIVTQATRNYSDINLTPSTTYSYRVSAQDAVGNVSALSAPVNGTTLTPDTTLPNVAISNPTQNATVSATTTVSADASDNVGVVGVQFKLDGNDLGLEDTSSPYSSNWDTTLSANGSHALTATARDNAGNIATSSPVTVNVLNGAGQSGFQSEIIVTGLDFPTNMEFLPDGSFIVGQLTGTVKRVLPGNTTAEPTPFLPLTNVGNAGGLQGLFDIVLDPNFATNRYFYVFYTLGSPNRDRISRFTMDPSGATAPVNSEVVIWQDPLSAGTDHHGGAMAFGNDSKLYFTTGDHFAGSEVSQQLDSHRGKVLRINSDGTVPSDNPFFDGAGPNYDAIWAYGFRNPFRMTVDQPTGRIFVADVGGNSYDTAREEVNLLSRGVNYHWPNCEGVCGAPGNPVYDYSHFVPGSTTQTRDASVTGGIVYRGSQFPSEYYGNYFFADYTQNWIRRLTFDQNNNFTGMQFFEPADGSLDAPIGAVVHLAEGPEGALYYTDIGWENESQITGGKIRRIKYNSGNLAPIVAVSGSPLNGIPPLTVDFSSTGTSDPENQPLAYLWTFGDGTTSTEANPQHAYSNNGQYTVRLQVSDGVLSTLSDPIIVRVGNLPQPTILTPSNGLTFRAGDIINFSGTATDTEDGPLPASAFSWQIFFHHNTHIHPAIPLNGATSGTYAIDTAGHDYSGNTNYELVLTVTDSDGLQNSTSVFFYPQKVNLTFGTLPAGLNIEIDGVSHVTPFVYDTLVNFQHVINAPDQIGGTNAYTFLSWSDSGAQSHTITVPVTDQTLTANFNVTNNIGQGLVAYWNFNETTGSIANDTSGNNNNLALSGGPAFVAGHNGNALNLDGTNDYGNAGDLDLNPFSISVWVKQPQALSSWGSVVMKRLTYGLEVSGQTMNFGVGNGTSWNATITTPITLNQWQHFVGVYNGTNITLYKDGVQIGASANGTLTNTNNPLLVGSWNTSGEFFNGMVDDARIYNRALSPSEVQQLFQL